ncbi:hypothetical protein PIB30_037571 [Stylosanthes scabra]|uniref:Histidine-containing phosphotransfer protein n=1 Tax=Stylosanthes scabra TaxID=79078 RepID=A0ABU6UCF9_9FABA|nr:hypothetical protein [Stylosanthes scabra]
MADVSHLKLQLFETFETMKKEGLVDEHFVFIHSLKDNIEDHFFLEVIPEFCSDTREVLKNLAQTIKYDDNLDYDQMREHVNKIKGSCLSFLGASRMAEACCAFEDAVNTASREECLKAVLKAKREYDAVEAKLHICLQEDLNVALAEMVTLSLMENRQLLQPLYYGFHCYLIKFHMSCHIIDLDSYLQKDKFNPRFYVAADTDNMSLQKAQLLENSLAAQYYNFPLGVRNDSTVSTRSPNESLTLTPLRLYILSISVTLTNANVPLLCTFLMLGSLASKPETF